MTNRFDSRGLLGLLFLLFMIAVMVDCSAGQTRHCPGLVLDHQYQAPYTTVDCHAETKGVNTCHSVYHPAQWRLLIDCQYPSHSVTVSVDPYRYFQIDNGSTVSVGERCGRWSGIAWLHWLDERNYLERSSRATY
ncbi:hypothetical protein [Spirosoma sordidisoli]|uniref:Uncharacterized protein n=1 Tax=Spirosoma sordidisoli TaxID=2502893 RepID=A0A4Q2UKP0_9BACT|nr:hypothetical protein [Spirosoma sordidisoli]RYC69786.1 hypothetical protein EQG79_14420 [Spirosoma sordidisoli]